MYTMFWLLTMYSSTLRWIHARQPVPSLAPSMFDSSTGSSSTELAKMIGTTPLWLTFSGM